MMTFIPRRKRRPSTTLAGIFSVAVGSALLLCGAGLTPTGNVQRSDINANGFNLTNAATVEGTNGYFNTVVATNQVTTPAISSGAGVTVTAAANQNINLVTSGTGKSEINGTAIGTVTSVSSTGLSPLFGVSVGTATTTPAFTFSLNNANQNSIFAGPASGGAGAPSFQTAPTFSGLNLTALPSNTALYPTLNQNTTGTSGGFTAGNASNLNSGTVPTARLGSGTASSSTILFGDQTYKSDSIFASAIPSGAANDSATGGAYVAASTTPTVSSYSAYPFYVISFAATSDNAADTVTLNINGLGAKPVLLSTGNQAEAFNFQNSGTPVLLYYNGTAFVEVNPNPNVMADTFSFGIPGSDPYFYSDSTQQVNIDGTNLILGNGASIGVGSGSNINLASGCPIAFPNSDIVDQYLQDINGETSLDFNNRYLIASDGSSDLLHWDTAADLQASLAAALTGFTGTLNLGSMTLGLTSSQIPGVNVQGLSTAIPLEAGLNVFSGSTARTTPLPAPASGAHVAVKSVASATETISSNSGSQIFATGATSASASVTLTSGSATEFWSDGTYWYQK